MKYRLQLKLGPLSRATLTGWPELGVCIASQFDGGDCDGVAERDSKSLGTVCLAFGDYTIKGQAQELSRATAMRDMFAAFQKIAPEVHVIATLTDEAEVEYTFDSRVGGARQVNEIAPRITVVCLPRERKIQIEARMDQNHWENYYEHKIEQSLGEAVDFGTRLCTSPRLPRGACTFEIGEFKEIEPDTYVREFTYQTSGLGMPSRDWMTVAFFFAHTLCECRSMLLKVRSDGNPYRIVLE